MKIGVFSDMHDRTDHLELAMRQMRLLDCGHFMFLGDCTTPESFQRLIELTGGLPLDAVPGNNDYELAIMRQLAACSPAARLHPEHVLLTRYGIKFSLSHYPKYAMQEAHARLKGTHARVRHHGLQIFPGLPLPLLLLPGRPGGAAEGMKQPEHQVK